jgi:AcrR family transcriptional regulator
MKTAVTAVKPRGRPTKGEETRALILDAALRLASAEGFEALTIGVLADQTGMSKSGLFAHFGSKEDLQIATLNEAVRRFNDIAVLPALAVPRGLERLRALFDLWVEWTVRGNLSSCPMMTATIEFDDKPGPVRDEVLRHMRRSHEGMVKAVNLTVGTGEFAADTDSEQFAFELFGIISTCYRSRNLFNDPRANDRARLAFERLVRCALAPPVAGGPSAATVVRRPTSKQ